MSPRIITSIDLQRQAAQQANPLKAYEINNRYHSVHFALEESSNAKPAPHFKEQTGYSVYIWECSQSYETQRDIQFIDTYIDHSS